MCQSAVIGVFEADCRNVKLVEGLDELLNLLVHTGIGRFNHVGLKNLEHLVEFDSTHFSAKLVLKKHCLGDLSTNLNDGVKRGKRILEYHRNSVTADGTHILLGYLEKVHTVVEYLTALNDRVSCENTKDSL